MYSTLKILVIVIIFQDGNQKNTLNTTSDCSLAPSINFVGVRIRGKLDSHCLKQDKVIFRFAL